MAFQLDIVTPEKRILSEPVDSVVLPGSEGEMNVLPGHVRLVTALVPGLLAIERGPSSLCFATGTGFVEITGESVAVLTIMAVTEQEIDEKAVEEALKLEEERFLDMPTSALPEDVSRVQDAIRVHQAQLQLKRRAKVQTAGT